MKTENKFIIMIGVDAAKKGHAARFALAQADAVRKAAALMGFRTGLPETEEAERLCAGLPMGKLFAAGRGLVPLVRATLYEELAKSYPWSSLTSRPMAPKRRRRPLPRPPGPI